MTMRRPMARMSKKPRRILFSPISTRNFLLALPSSAPSLGMDIRARRTIYFNHVDRDRARVTIG